MVKKRKLPPLPVDNSEEKLEEEYAEWEETFEPKKKHE